MLFCLIAQVVQKLLHLWAHIDRLHAPHPDKSLPHAFLTLPQFRASDKYLHPWNKPTQTLRSLADHGLSRLVFDPDPQGRYVSK